MSERLHSVTSVFSDFDSDYDLNVNRNAGDDENDDGFENDGAGGLGIASGSLKSQLSIVQELEKDEFMKEAEAELELERIIDVGKRYPHSTLKPCLEGVDKHKEKDYIVLLLQSAENTLYVLSEKEEIWVPAQVMARVIVTTRYQEELK